MYVPVLSLLTIEYIRFIWNIYSVYKSFLINSLLILFLSYTKLRFSLDVNADFLILTRTKR